MMDKIVFEEKSMRKSRMCGFDLIVS